MCVCVCFKDIPYHLCIHMYICVRIVSTHVINKLQHYRTRQMHLKLDGRESEWKKNRQIVWTSTALLNECQNIADTYTKYILSFWQIHLSQCKFVCLSLKLYLTLVKWHSGMECWGLFQDVVEELEMVFSYDKFIKSEIYRITLYALVNRLLLGTTREYGDFSTDLTRVNYPDLQPRYNKFMRLIIDGVG